MLLAAMIFVTPYSTIDGSILEAAPLRRLGLISDGFYIFHYPVQELFARLLVGLADPSLGQFGWLFAGLSLAGSVAVAALAFRLLERPVMRLASGRRPGSRDGVVGQQHSGRRPEPAVGHDRPDHPPVPDGDWRQVTVQFRGRQLATLRLIADAQRISLSAVARHLLATYIADQLPPPASLLKPVAVDGGAWR